ncbi:hypothetical protein CXF58_05190 [Psychrobacter sp. Sarcosine-02u-2]|uniref:hypothetical protein n=1 Tax=Psychrobacter sp. Sarcosine-02u-2 TaxID=2058324 RepID=UPI000C7BA089|nr:hypothetical protein [Psychrobacter sp. Sarcosine-02u-2]PKG86620.1 hypothetical protein CXF58_05190 [Psychrobacter sp. Sarcosine-02u-2]
MSINIAGSEYDKISAHFYCVNFRRRNRMNITSFYDAKNRHLCGWSYDYSQRSAIDADSFNSYFATC